MEFITFNGQETKKNGFFLGEEILKTKDSSQQALVFGLSGDLGSGKTTFIQGIAQGLKIKEKITSPTFVIMKKYNIQYSSSNIKHLYHIDCYRINSQDLLELGFKEIISQPENLVILEWAKRVKKALPQETVWINFEYLDQDKRKIEIKNY